MSFIERVINILNNDGTILVPSDTHFAIAVNPNSAKALDWLVNQKSILNVKEITFCFTELEQIWDWIDVSAWERIQLDILSNTFWPGPLKISLKASEAAFNNILPDKSIAVVCVKNAIFREIITVLGMALAVIPAGYYGNSTKLVSFTKAREGFGTAVDLVVPTRNKNMQTKATTHISLINDTITILRQGELDITDYL